MADRTILHSDANSFYASVETVLDPKLRGKAVAVCGSTDERHGIVLAKSEQAKKCGVKTGMVNREALNCCKDLIVVHPHYDYYLKFSRLLHGIYKRYTDRVEPFGMDECWLDLSASGIGGIEAAEEIRTSVEDELGLTVSIGVSFNKIFAKLGSDMKKPDAITTIPKESFKEKIWHLPASDMLGVGRATEKKLSSVGIHTIGQIAQFPVDFFQRRLGKCGVDLWRFANGLDDSKVTVRETEAPDKSVGHGMTALQDLENPAEVWTFILELCQDIGHRLYVFNKKATGIALAIRDNELFTKQWQCGIPVATQSPSCLAKEAFSLFMRSYNWRKPIRSLTVRAINLVSLDTPSQLDVFVDAEKLARIEALDQTIEELRYRFGKDIIRNACLLNNPKMSAKGNPNIIMPTGIPQ